MKESATIERGPRGKVYTCVGFNSDGGCATSGYFVYGIGAVCICILCKNQMVRAQCGGSRCTAKATRINVEIGTGLIVARCECH